MFGQLRHQLGVARALRLNSVDEGQVARLRLSPRRHLLVEIALQRLPKLAVGVGQPGEVVALEPRLQIEHQRLVLDVGGALVHEAIAHWTAPRALAPASAAAGEHPPRDNLAIGPVHLPVRPHVRADGVAVPAVLGAGRPVARDGAEPIFAHLVTKDELERGLLHVEQLVNLLVGEVELHQTIELGDGPRLAALAGDDELVGEGHALFEQLLHADGRARGVVRRLVLRSLERLKLARGERRLELLQQPHLVHWHLPPLGSQSRHLLVPHSPRHLLVLLGRQRLLQLLEQRSLVRGDGHLLLAQHLHLVGETLLVQRSDLLRAESLREQGLEGLLVVRHQHAPLRQHLQVSGHHGRFEALELGRGERLLQRLLDGCRRLARAALHGRTLGVEHLLAQRHVVRVECLQLGRRQRARERLRDGRRVNRRPHAARSERLRLTREACGVQAAALLRGAVAPYEVAHLVSERLGRDATRGERLDRVAVHGRGERLELVGSQALPKHLVHDRLVHRRLDALGLEGGDAKGDAGGVGVRGGRVGHALEARTELLDRRLALARGAQRLRRQVLRHSDAVLLAQVTQLVHAVGEGLVLVLEGGGPVLEVVDAARPLLELLHVALQLLLPLLRLGHLHVRHHQLLLHLRTLRAPLLLLALVVGLDASGLGHQILHLHPKLFVRPFQIRHVQRVPAQPLVVLQDVPGVLAQRRQVLVEHELHRVEWQPALLEFIVLRRKLLRAPPVGHAARAWACLALVVARRIFPRRLSPRVSGGGDAPAISRDALPHGFFAAAGLSAG